MLAGTEFNLAIGETMVNFTGKARTAVPQRRHGVGLGGRLPA